MPSKFFARSDPPQCYENEEFYLLILCLIFFAFLALTQWQLSPMRMQVPCAGGGQGRAPLGTPI